MYFNCTCTNPHKDSYANNLGYQKLMIVFFQCLVVRSITKKEKLKKRDRERDFKMKKKDISFDLRHIYFGIAHTIL